MPLSPAEASASVNPVLTDAFNSYSPSMFTWFQEAVAPTVVNDGVALSGQIPCYTTDALKVDDDTHTVGKDANLLDISHRTFQSYTMLPHSLSIEQSSQEDKRLRQAGTDPDRELLRRIEALKLKMMINEHASLYTLVSTTGNYESSTQYPAAATAWSSLATADATTDMLGLKTAIAAIRGIDARCACVNRKAADYARHQDSTKAYLGSDRTKIVTYEDLRLLWELDELTVTDAQNDTTAATVAASFSPIWGAIACIFNKPRNLDINGVNGWEFARTIRNDNGPAQVFSSDNDPRKAPDKGGYYFVHTVKAGYYVAKMVAINSGSDPDSLVGGIVTGLY